VLGAVAIVRPETIIRWHRAGFRVYWRWGSRNHVGRPKVSAELRALVGEMSRANPLWGAPRYDLNEIFERVSLQLSDLSEEFDASGTQPSPIILKALQNGHIALIEDVSAQPLSISSACPVTSHPGVVLLCERQRRHANEHWNQNQDAIFHGLPLW